ncbi:MAG: PHP domain-containing protein, partial [Nitrospinota bacterium]|nr:PHP domain-containing protein [Nitrospinota bacterium]
MHTSCSDGLDSPQALLERASGRGISVVSITDHDTFKAYEQANKVAEDLGIELITGIEVSTFYKGGSVHLLGYFVDGDSAAAKKLVESNHAGRLERMEKILAHLDRLGYQVDMDELLVFAGEGTLGRVSLARFMVKKKLFRTTEEVFQKVLGDGKSAYEA